RADAVQQILEATRSPHRSLNKDAPASRRVQQSGRIVSHALLGGLHDQYVGKLTKFDADAEFKQLVVLVIFLTTFNFALIPLVEPPDSPPIHRTAIMPVTIAVTKTKTSIRPLASDTRAGPGQYPASPQPAPKITAPETRGVSMAVEVGRLKRGDQSGRPRPNTSR